MQTGFSSDEVDLIPIPCTVYVQHEEEIGVGMVWGFYPQRCHVQSQLPVSPGATVSLSLHLPGTGRVRIKPCLVTWARASEFGLQFPESSVLTRHEKTAAALDLATLDPSCVTRQELVPEVTRSDG